ncbi:MAG: type I 3-dehydroquinate dehydratase [Chthoniobacterales bacterium]|nr:type I 3-dehydroquinate dehydratase [Chthoniobacterales bacterium]
MLVAIAHTQQGLRKLSNQFHPDSRLKWCPDIVELRLDLFSPQPDSLTSLPFPILLTLRHSSEGGKFSGSPDQHLETISPYLPFATALDIELTRAQSYPQTLSLYLQKNFPMILSYHNFSETPPYSFLCQLLHEATSLGASALKIATALQKPSDLIPLIQILAHSTRLPIAVMAIGPLAPTARLFLAAAGSVLNYGWLHKPIVPGQLSAPTLAKLLHQFNIRPALGHTYPPPHSPANL